MREALTILGFGPCHHMFEVMANDDQKRLWRALAKGAAPDWKSTVCRLRFLHRLAFGALLA